MSLLDGLIAYYGFDEGVGLAALDATGASNTGTLINGPTWTAGKINGALSFLAASNQYVDCGTAINPTAISFSAWIKATSFPNTYNAVVARENGANNFALLLIKSTGKLAVYMGVASGFVDYDGTGTNTLSAGTWYHVACTYDSTSGVRGYVNGTLDGSAAANGILTTTIASTYIGQNPNQSRAFNGIIDEVRIGNRALTAAEVAQLYNNGQGLPYPFGVRRMGRPLGSRIIVP